MQKNTHNSFKYFVNIWKQSYWVIIRTSKFRSFFGYGNNFARLSLDERRSDDYTEVITIPGADFMILI